MSEATTSIYLSTPAIATAVIVLLYTVGSAGAAIVTHFLYRFSEKQVVYVTLLSLTIFAQQIFTIAQTSYALLRWPELMKEYYNWEQDQWQNPNAHTTYQPSPNLVIRVLFGCRMFFFNCESLLVFFWALMLFLTVYDIKSLGSPRFVQISKYICFVLPLVQQVVIHIPIIVQKDIVHITITQSLIVISLTCACFLMALILIRCIRVMVARSGAYGHDPWMADDSCWADSPLNDISRPTSSNAPTITMSPVERIDGSPISRSSSRASSRAETLWEHDTSNDNKEDRYIILRFLVGLIMLAGLLTAFVLAQIFYTQRMNALKSADAKKPKLGWTQAHQIQDWAFFLGGSSSGYLNFLIFGTTFESRVQIRRFWRRLRGRADADAEWLAMKHDPQAEWAHDNESRSEMHNFSVEQAMLGTTGSLGSTVTPTSGKSYKSTKRQSWRKRPGIPSMFLNPNRVSRMDDPIVVEENTPLTPATRRSRMRSRAYSRSDIEETVPVLYQYPMTVRRERSRIRHGDAAAPQDSDVPTLKIPVARWPSRRGSLNRRGSSRRPPVSGMHSAVHGRNRSRTVGEVPELPADAAKTVQRMKSLHMRTPSRPERVEEEDEGKIVDTRGDDDGKYVVANDEGKIVVDGKEHFGF